MSTLFQKSQILFNALQRKNALFDLSIDSRFSDEPMLHHVNAYISVPNTEEKIPAGGVSFFSRNKALIKCLGESVERLAQYSKPQIIAFGSYNSLSKPALKPSLFEQKEEANGKELAWIEGRNLFTGRKLLIPAQAAYFDYDKMHKEKRILYPWVTTGAAGEFTKEDALLRGIYESIERDSIMTIYLNKIRAPKIDLFSLKSRKIKYIVELCKKYRLEPSIFDIRTDLNVPTFFCVLTDETGIGPALTCGAKCDYDIENAIIGSIEESFQIRTWIRRLKAEAMLKGVEVEEIMKEYKIRTHVSRAAYWTEKESINKLNFLLDQPKIKYRNEALTLNSSDKLNRLVAILKDKMHDIYYTDIALPFMRKMHYKVIKVIIPSLHPLYLFEKEKKFSIRKKRLNEVANFFGYKGLVINPIPHPFL